MPDIMSEAEREQLQKTINDSGFPLQMGLKLLVQGDPRAHSWQVSLTEHPWRDPLTDDPRFVDLVLKGHGANGPLRLIIECKRARETEWLFLREPPDSPHSDNRLNIRARIFASNPQASFDHWEDVPFIPGSPQAEYCVVRKNKGRSDDLVEKPAAEIVRAADALAMQEFHLYSRGSLVPDRSQKPIGMLFIPIIVTTAKMYICEADFQAVNLETGELSAATIRPVNVVRFAKSFGTGDAKRAGGISIEDFAQQSERSVVIVQASAFLDFLSQLDIGRSSSQLISALYPGLK